VGGRRGKGEGDRKGGSEHYRKYIIMHENSTIKPIRKGGREGGEHLRKSNRDGLNLMKVAHMHVVNITTKPFCTIYANKNLRR
jgi:hypothetical protein